MLSVRACRDPAPGGVWRSRVPGDAYLKFIWHSERDNTATILRVEVVLGALRQCETSCTAYKRPPTTASALATGKSVTGPHPMVEPIRRFLARHWLAGGALETPAKPPGG